MKNSQWNLVRSDRNEGPITQGYQVIIPFPTKCLPSLKWDLVFYVEIAMPFNYDVAHYMGLVMPFNYEDSSTIMRYNLATWSCNRMHGDEHRSNHPLGCPREHRLRVLVHYVQAQGPRVGSRVFIEAKVQSS